MPLLIATAVAALCSWIVISYGHKLTNPIGNATWDFSSSGATNATALGTVFSFLMQSTVLPEKQLSARRTQYALLGAPFAGARTAAPVVQGITGTTSKDPGAADTPEPIVHGVVGGFILACLFTIWGALVQTGVQVFTARELWLAWAISDSVYGGAVGCGRDRFDDL